jgi:hypothetical protein
VAPPVVEVKKKRSLLSLIVRGGLVLLAGSCIASNLSRDSAKDAPGFCMNPMVQPASYLDLSLVNHVSKAMRHFHGRKCPAFAEP